MSRPDPIPRVRAGGFHPRGSEFSAAMCINPHTFPDQNEPDERASTPERLFKYRKTHNAVPGIKTVHPGMYDDIENRDISNTTFGKNTAGSIQVG